MTERHFTVPEAHAGVDHSAVDRDPRQTPAGGHPTIGIATARPEEYAAMRLFVDDAEQEHVDADRCRHVVGTVPSLASGRPHRVVLALLGAGDGAATAACARSFGSVDQIVTCGIAAGIPARRRRGDRVRLGDIVVATGGIVDFDPGGARLRRPSQVLTRAADILMAAEYAGESPWIGLIESGLRRSPSFAPPHASDPGEHPPRATHASDPRVHHGRIGSADRAVRDARLRDRLAAEHDLLALETEGKTIGDGGFADDIDRLVVRGVGGLAGEKIDHRWRPYAALVAAAYVRCLLRECPAVAPRAGP